MKNEIKAVFFFFLFVCSVFNVNAKSKKDAQAELDEIKNVDNSKLVGVWERQGTLEIDGNTDVETIQFNEDGSVSYRLNGQIGLFPTPYVFTLGYGVVEVKAVFEYYYIDGSLIVTFADKKVKTFTRRRGGTNQPQQRNAPLSPAQNQQTPQRGTMQPVPGGPSQNLNPYLR
ncbi:MAG: hypothetical protein LBC53_08505 [Spirochaetaceae bacterium]|jgi:hypothetical protein|nr:hypothetical protein [Spirochaetaceae bacterium]